MSEQAVLILLGAAVALLSSLVTAIVQNRLSLRREYSLKWWERKADAYSEIMERLARLRYTEHNLLQVFYQVHDGKDAKEATRLSDLGQYINDFSQATTDIMKVALGNSLVISYDTAEAVAKLAYKMLAQGMGEKLPDLPDSAEALAGSPAIYHAITSIRQELPWLEECIEEVRAFAKADLQVR